MNDEMRVAIVAEARSWLGTPYHHQANLKGVGVDCAMILVEVYAAVGLIDWFDPRPYPTDWHLHRSAERYIDHLLDHTRETDTPKPGDILLCRWGRTFSHSAIVVEWPIVIHAYSVDRCVSLGDATKAPFAGRPLRFFTWAQV
jgi:NlpC/P60 family putative phage cell wall peptidase